VKEENTNEGRGNIKEGSNERQWGRENQRKLLNLREENQSQ
jgi:hypothetical protein